MKHVRLVKPRFKELWTWILLPFIAFQVSKWKIYLTSLDFYICTYLEREILERERREHIRSETPVRKWHRTPPPSAIKNSSFILKFHLCCYFVVTSFPFPWHLVATHQLTISWFTFSIMPHKRGRATCSPLGLASFT